VDKFFPFLTFWSMQGVWVLIISMPMLFVNACLVQRPQLGRADWVALTGFIAGVALEVVADVQKAIWVRAGRAGGFCQAGIWSYSRHPNYFGEMLQWWCAWAFAYGSASGLTDWVWWLCGLCPLFTMQVLVNMPQTGLTQANGKSLKRYYDTWPEAYSKYRTSTSILVPMVGYAHVPMFLKRTVFFDFERFEYRPRGTRND